jgi:hypothetical protein
MAILQQQLRNSTAAAKPGDLEPGQLAYNLADSLGYIGNGGNQKTLVDGSTGAPAPTAGKGWIEFALKVADIATVLDGTFIPDPGTFTGPPPAPTNGQVLTWDSTADGGAGGYVPATPGSPAVYSIPNDDANIGTGGPLTADLNAGLIGIGAITSAGDLNTGDSCIVTDSGNPDTSANVPPGSYTWDGTVWILSPSGGGANILSDLANVNTTPTAVTGANQAGLLVRDTTVVTETAAGAYKITTSVDSGTY